MLLLLLLLLWLLQRCWLQLKKHQQHRHHQCMNLILIVIYFLNNLILINGQPQNHEVYFTHHYQQPPPQQHQQQQPSHHQSQQDLSSISSQKHSQPTTTQYHSPQMHHQHQQQQQQHQSQLHHQQQQPQHQHQHQHQQSHLTNKINTDSSAENTHKESSRSSYALLSQAMSEAVSHEMNNAAAAAAAGNVGDSSCVVDDVECLENVHDRLGMEAIKSLHQQLDDDDNGNIDLTESDDFLREELKYDYGYEKRQKLFHYNDDTQISVKELWEAWLRSEVHNWTVVQTADWLTQSVQLPQYVNVFEKHKVSGETLPRLAVNNMHYVSSVLGIRDPIHRQKIALKAMDVVLFGPPRETGTRWKDYFLITLLLTAIIGSWYAYQQNKMTKRHLRRMAKDMEGLQRAENALTEMQKELELARLEQENVATEKLDLERRLKEAPTANQQLTNGYDNELQQLKQECERLRSELARAEIELVDHQNNWTAPIVLQSWLQLTYELENGHTLKKRNHAEKQLQLARDACEKLKRKGSSLVGAFISTHGKSIDDVNRSIIEARNALAEVTSELQERLNRWKQIEQLVGFNIVNNNGIAYLENILYTNNNTNTNTNNNNNNNNNNSSTALKLSSTKSSNLHHSLSQSQDDLLQHHYDQDDSGGSDDGGGAAGIGISDNTTQMLSNDRTSNTSSMFYLMGNENTIQQSSQIQQPIQQQLIKYRPISVNHHPFIQQTFIPENPIADIALHSDDEHQQYNKQNSSILNLTPTANTITAAHQRIPPIPPPRRATSHQNISKSSNSSMMTKSLDINDLSVFSIGESPSTSNINQPSTSIGLTSQHQQSVTSQLSHQTTPLQLQSQSQSQQQTSTVALHEDASNSTDSSTFSDDFKKHRRKIHFPFGKKSHQKKYK